MSKPKAFPLWQLALGIFVSYLGIVATSMAYNGGALEWLWVGGLICLAGMLILCCRLENVDDNV